MLTRTVPAAQTFTVWSLLASALRRALTTARIYNDEFADAEAKAAECEGGRHRHFVRRKETTTPSHGCNDRSES
jgi:hypothetical protein